MRITYFNKASALSSDDRNSFVPGERVPFFYDRFILDPQRKDWNIKLFFIGTSGLEMARYYIDHNSKIIDYCVVDSMKSMLNTFGEDHCVQIGETICKGLGAGGDSDLGQRAILPNIDDVRAALKGVDIAFLISGLGGGISSGATPVLAQLYRESGIFSIGIVTMPFAFEGLKREKQSTEVLNELSRQTNVVLPIHLDMFSEIAAVLSSDDRNAFKKALLHGDKVVSRVINGIQDFITYGLKHYSIRFLKMLEKSKLIYRTCRPCGVDHKFNNLRSTDRVESIESDLDHAKAIYVRVLYETDVSTAVMDVINSFVLRFPKTSTDYFPIEKVKEDGLGDDVIVEVYAII